MMFVYFKYMFTLGNRIYKYINNFIYYNYLIKYLITNFIKNQERFDLIYNFNDEIYSKL